MENPYSPLVESSPITYVTPDDLDSLMIEPNDPRYLGNCRCYFYKNHQPKIMIGPECIYSYI